MQSLLWAAIVVLSATVALNLALTFAVIRRLRDTAATPAASGPAAGGTVPSFTVAMTDGTTLTDRDLHSGAATIVFALPGCKPCTTTLATLPGTEPTYVFVMGEPGEQGTGEVLAKAPAFARTAVTPMDGPVGRAFGVTLFPTTVRVVDGVITEAGNGALAGAGV